MLFLDRRETVEGAALGLRAVVDPYNPIRVRQKDNCEYKARLYIKPLSQECKNSAHVGSTSLNGNCTRR